MKTVTLLIVLLLVACVPYSPPAPDVPQAELILRSNLEDDAAASNNWSHFENFFVAFADGECLQELGTLAGFRGFGSQRGPKELVRLAAGKRIYIRADSTTVTHGGIGQQKTTRYCHSLVSFVPEDGEVYEIHQTDHGPPIGECLTTLRNVNGRQPTKSFMEHRIEGRCAQLIGDKTPQ